MTPVKNVRTVMIVLMAILIYVGYQCTPANFGVGSVFVNVEKGDSLGTVAKRLKDSGVIRNEDMLKIYMKLRGFSGEIKPGSHLFKSGYSFSDIADELVSVNLLEKKLVVPEGYTIAQIQDSINELSGDKDNRYFSKLALNVPFGSVDFIPVDSLEGYLFPDTYKIYKETSEKQIISLMLENFKRQVNSTYYNDIVKISKDKFNVERFPEALYKIVTIASLIEREVKVSSERKLVASVIYNRLEIGMPLQIDASISYVPGESTDNKSKTTFADTRSNSKYNTYKNKGLPPGPICNPGIESIKAAIYPEKTDYKYYVAKPDGSHVFSKTFEEHKAAMRGIRN